MVTWSDGRVDGVANKSIALRTGTLTFELGGRECNCTHVSFRTAVQCRCKVGIPVALRTALKEKIMAWHVAALPRPNPSFHPSASPLTPHPSLEPLLSAFHRWVERLICVWHIMAFPLIPPSSSPLFPSFRTHSRAPQRTPHTNDELLQAASGRSVSCCRRATTRH